MLSNATEIIILFVDSELTRSINPSTVCFLPVSSATTTSSVIDYELSSSLPDTTSSQHKLSFILGGAVGGAIATLLFVCGVAGVGCVVVLWRIKRHQPRRKLLQEQRHEGMAIGNVTYEGGKIMRGLNNLRERV